MLILAGSVSRKSIYVWRVMLEVEAEVLRQVSVGVKLPARLIPSDIIVLATQ